jgi:7-cyano-7-deazaguanine reductase
MRCIKRFEMRRTEFAEVSRCSSVKFQGSSFQFQGSNYINIMFKDSSIPLEKALAKRLLPPIETFPCPYRTMKNASGIIRIVFPEFTCVCPRTGYPDFGVISLLYLPRSVCIELKSWKLYLNSFRMIGTFHETVTGHLFSLANKLLKPRWTMLIGDFLPRGNVDTTIIFETKGRRPAGVDILLKPLLPRCKTLNFNLAGTGGKVH